MKKEFNKLLKSSIGVKKISLRELARKSGLDVSFLSKILSGKRNPPSNEKDIIKIASILDIEADRLLFASGRIPSHLQEIFNDENFIRSLSGKEPVKKVSESIEKPKPQSKPKPKKKQTRIVVPTIEDELL